MMLRIVVFIVVILVILLLGMLAFNERERCPDPDQVWVLSDGKWICVRKD